MTPQPKTRTERPLFAYSTPELEQLAQKSKSSPQNLAAVGFELQFRRRKAAEKLRDYVRARLSALGHPFPWPTTDAAPSQRTLDQGAFDTEFGLLRTRGYRVGNDGVDESERRDILDEIYKQVLRGHPQAKEWGKPRTADRLRKLANVIASCARNAKRKGNSYRVAIAEWESDLKYLKKSFYIGKYELEFKWPKTVSRPHASADRDDACQD